MPLSFLDPEKSVGISTTLCARLGVLCVSVLDLSGKTTHHGGTENAEDEQRKPASIFPTDSFSLSGNEIIERLHPLVSLQFARSLEPSESHDKLKHVAH